MRTAPTPTTVTRIGIAFEKRSIVSDRHCAGFEVTSRTPMQNLAMAVIAMVKLFFIEI